MAYSVPKLVPGYVVIHSRRRPASRQSLVFEQAHGARQMVGGGYQQNMPSSKNCLALDGIFVSGPGPILHEDGRFQDTEAQSPPFHFMRYQRTGTKYSGVPSGEQQLGGETLDPQVCATGGALA